MKNLSCRCPPWPNPSIPDHNTRQGMLWEYTEGLPSLRWWPESVFPGFPGFPKNAPFSSRKQAHALSP